MEYEVGKWGLENLIFTGPTEVQRKEARKIFDELEQLHSSKEFVRNKKMQNLLRATIVKKIWRAMITSPHATRQIKEALTICIHIYEKLSPSYHWLDSVIFH